MMYGTIVGGEGSCSHGGVEIDFGVKNNERMSAGGSDRKGALVLKRRAPEVKAFEGERGWSEKENERRRSEKRGLMTRRAKEWETSQGVWNQLWTRWAVNTAVK
jgi:hypothetical protein